MQPMIINENDWDYPLTLQQIDSRAMNSLFKCEPNTLLSHLTSDNDVRIKHSQSSEYTEPHYTFQLDRLYQDTMQKMQKLKFQLGEQYQVQYRTETHSGKLAYLRMVLEYFIDKLVKGAREDGNGNGSGEDNQIQCGDCKNYENYLQKLENDIRQHIRLEQQLKLYQESLEEKIEEQKKELADKVAKHEEEIYEWKAKEKGLAHKIARLEQETDRIKHETIKNRSGLLAEHSHRAIREPSQTKSFKILNEMKQNCIGQRSSHKKQDRKEIVKEEKKEDRKQSRKSVEKRPQSSERWRYSNTNSNKHFPLAEKLIVEKNKQEKRKAIQAKFELRK